MTAAEGSVFAYLDTNALNDFFELRGSVNAVMQAQLLGAVDGGRLVIPFSEAVAQEIAAITRGDRAKAVAFARFYLRVASLDHALDSTGNARRSSMAEYVGEAPHARFERLTQEERQNVETRLLDQDSGELDAIVADYRRDQEAWANEYRGRRDQARARRSANALALGQELRTGISQREATAELWPEFAPHWASGLLESGPLAVRLREAGFDAVGLLRVPVVRASVGFLVGLVAAQIINGRNPHVNDYGDFQHVVQATCARLPLVTHDDDLCRLVEAIPDTPLLVLSAAELMKRVGQGADV